jgi:DNA-binding FadR family transcriptional regulator
LAVKRGQHEGQEPEGPGFVGLTTATARVLLPIDDSNGRADFVARRLGEAIRLGLLLDRERLPNEMRLAEQFGVSPVTLREALAMLREQGLVVTRRGHGGGTFVTAPADRGEPLERFTVEQLRDLGDQRKAISGAAAKFAALRASPEEVRRLEEQVQRLKEARTPTERRRFDTQFTIEVAAAGQSPRLTLQEARVLAEVGELLGLEDESGVHAAFVRNRRRLVAAIRARRGDDARRLAESHVDAQTQRLIRLRLSLHEAPRRRGQTRTPDAILGEIAREIERIWEELAALGSDFRSLVERNEEPRSDDLRTLRPAIFDVLGRHEPLVTGAGVIVAPDVLTNVRLWQEWWWKGGRGAPEALRINLDPTAPDYYDYTAKDWYELPESTGSPLLSGPTVDYACTNEYAITLSVPVHSAERMLGVAAADVLISSLERLVLPALAEFKAAVALINGDGRVIASNSPHTPPGQSIELGTADAPLTSRLSRLHPWSIAFLGDQD